MPRRSPRWVWAGRMICLLVVSVVVGYLVLVGVDKADKVASSIGAVLALIALFSPYLLPSPDSTAQAGPPVTAGGAGAVAVGGNNGGWVSTDVSGIDPTQTGITEAVECGITASGAGSVAVGGDNTATVRTNVKAAGPASE